MAELARAATPELAATLRRWFEACAADPGCLPPGVELVHRRLVRSVGRAELPDGGHAFLKVMAFPRAKDRLRYALRPLPATAESRALDRLRQRAPELPIPEVLGVLAARRRGLPWLSVLVTRGLPVSSQPPAFDAMARCAARLAAVGLFHPDLNAGNFLRLDDGRTAILDLQSLRLGRAPLGRRRRLAMAAKLLSDAGPPGRSAGALVEAGLLRSPADAAAAEQAAARLDAATRRKRLLRCMRESTEFRVRRGLRGTRYERRGASTPLSAVPGGPELVELWLADRALELWADRRPRLHALFRKSWWARGRNCVYISGPCGIDTWHDVRASLAEGLHLVRDVLRFRGPEA